MSKSDTILAVSISLGLLSGWCSYSDAKDLRKERVDLKKQCDTRQCLSYMTPVYLVDSGRCVCMEEAK